MPSSQDDLIKKNARTGGVVLLVVAGMIALSFASVPLYNLFCSVTGYGGTTQTSSALPDKVLERDMEIRFNTQTSKDLPWSFTPDLHATTIKVGARGLASFTAENLSHTPTTGTAIYNVTPPKAGKYFHKIQCFCFDEQTLQPDQSVSMPVMFYVDPSIADDPNMEDVKTITLSYSFFPADTKALEDAMDAFYNAP